MDQFVLKVTTVNGRDLSSPQVLAFFVSKTAQFSLARDADDLFEMTHTGNIGLNIPKAGRPVPEGYVGKTVHITALEEGHFDRIETSVEPPGWQDGGVKFRTNLKVTAGRD